MNPTDALKSLHFISTCFHWSLWMLRSTRSLWCFIIILSVFEIKILHFLTISTVVDNMVYSFIMFNVRHSSRWREPDHIRSPDCAFKYIAPSFRGYFPILNAVETFHEIWMLMAFFTGLQTWWMMLSINNMRKTFWMAIYWKFADFFSKNSGKLCVFSKMLTLNHQMVHRKPQKFSEVQLVDVLHQALFLIIIIKSGPNQFFEASKKRFRELLQSQKNSQKWFSLKQCWNIKDC